MKTERTAKEVNMSLDFNTREYARIKALEDEYKAQREAVRSRIIEDMVELEIDTYPTNEYTYSKVDAFTREDVDKKKLVENFPNVFEKVKKLTNVKESIRVTETSAFKKAKKEAKALKERVAKGVE